MKLVRCISAPDSANLELKRLLVFLSQSARLSIDCNTHGHSPFPAFLIISNLKSKSDRLVFSPFFIISGNWLIFPILRVEIYNLLITLLLPLLLWLFTPILGHLAWLERQF